MRMLDRYALGEKTETGSYAFTEENIIRFAKRCGVSTSLRGLMSGAATALIGNVGPDRLIEALDVAQGPIGDVHPHYFTFGNLIATADYASAMARKNATAAIA